MIPKKIKALLDSLLKSTENEELKWYYNDDESFVSLETSNFKLSIHYKFNYDQEIGTFRVEYVNLDKYKIYYFHTDQTNKDYELVSALYDVAQSSDLDLNLNNI